MEAILRSVCEDFERLQPTGMHVVVREQNTTRRLPHLSSAEPRQLREQALAVLTERAVLLPSLPGTSRWRVASRLISPPL
eukprot:s1144_g3.t1